MVFKESFYRPSPNALTTERLQDLGALPVRIMTQWLARDVVGSDDAQSVDGYHIVGPSSPTLLRTHAAIFRDVHEQRKNAEQPGYANVVLTRGGTYGTRLGYASARPLAESDDSTVCITDVQLQLHSSARNANNVSLLLGEIEKVRSNEADPQNDRPEVLRVVSTADDDVLNDSLADLGYMLDPRTTDDFNQQIWQKPLSFAAVQAA